MLDSETANTLLYWGGIPALVLTLFFTLMWKFKFAFLPIEPRFAGWIAVLFLLLTAGITMFALIRFSEPDRVPVVSHEGPLSTLLDQLRRDSNSSFVLTLTGNAKERELLGQLFILPTSAGSYPDLMRKICDANARCINCNAATVSAIAISMTGKISKSCTVKGEQVFCCS